MKKLTREEFINKAIQKHGYKYDYSCVDYINSTTKVKIILKETNQIFYQKPNTHLSGKSPEKRINLFMSTENFKEKANSIHNNKYLYHLVDYKGCYEDVVIVCPEHGKFKQIANSHLNGKGCYNCGKVKNVINQKTTLEEFVKRANEVHLNRYDYSNTQLVNQLTKVRIICSEHGEFHQKPSKHLSGQGCPKCKSSKGEYIISKILDDKNIEYIKEHKFSDCFNIKKLSFDFFIPSINLCIEYDGIQHYEPRELFGGEEEFEKTKKRDLIKNKYCDENNINLIRISYKDNIVEKINSIL